MRRVLLTRPQQDSLQLAARLQRLGIESVIEPLLLLKPVATNLPELNRTQAVMITSAHALDFIDRTRCENQKLFTLPCFCVGTNTAAAAKAFGFQTVHDASGDGLALAQQIKRSLDAKKSNLLHIAGRDVDSRGRDELEKAGFSVTVWTTYAAEAATSLSPNTQSLFRENKLAAVLLFSARTAETLTKLLIQQGLETCCKDVIALGISDRVTEALGALPWRRRIAALLPTEDAVLQSLQDNLSEVL